MATFSHSRLSSYETCPLRYKFAYIDRVKVEAEDTVETFLGSRAHEALRYDLEVTKRLGYDMLRKHVKREGMAPWCQAVQGIKKGAGFELPAPCRLCRSLARLMTGPHPERVVTLYLYLHAGTLRSHSVSLLG